MVNLIIEFRTANPGVGGELDRIPIVRPIDEGSFRWTYFHSNQILRRVVNHHAKIGRQYIRQYIANTDHNLDGPRVKIGCVDALELNFALPVQARYC